MSKITNDDLTRSGTECFICDYGNSDCVCTFQSSVANRQNLTMNSTTTADARLCLVGLVWLDERRRADCSEDD